MCDQEVPAIVIDNGSDMCRVGFSYCNKPTIEFPSVIGRIKCKSLIEIPDTYVGDAAHNRRIILTLNYPIKQGIITNWDDMEVLWHHAFEKELKVASEMHNVLLSDSPFRINVQREKVAEIMFEKFKTKGIQIVFPGLLSFYGNYHSTRDSETGILFNSGHELSYILPVIDNKALLQDMTIINMGGSTLTNYFINMLENRGYLFSSNNERHIARTIKEKSCYITLNFEKNMKEFSYTDISCNDYVIGNELFRCPEALFRPDMVGKNFDGVPEQIYSSIKKYDFETQKLMFKNIILSGGNTMYLGIAERIKQQISHLDRTRKINVLAKKNRQHSVWKGGALISSILYNKQDNDKWITMQEYEETGASIVRRYYL